MIWNAAVCFVVRLSLRLYWTRQLWPKSKRWTARPFLPVHDGTVNDVERILALIGPKKSRKS